MSTPEIVGWILFGTFLIHLVIHIVRVIIKTLKICSRQTDKYSLEDNTADDPVSHYKYNVIFKPHVPHMSEDVSKP